MTLIGRVHLLTPIQQNATTSFPCQSLAHSAEFSSIFLMTVITKAAIDLSIQAPHPLQLTLFYFASINFLHALICMEEDLKFVTKKALLGSKPPLAICSEGSVWIATSFSHWGGPVKEGVCVLGAARMKQHKGWELSGAGTGSCIREVSKVDKAEVVCEGKAMV